MEKRVKSFTQFFESTSSGNNQSYTYSIFIEAAEEYGYPIFVLKESGDLFDVDGNLLDAPDVDDLFEEYMDAEHGPMNGIDGFGDLVDAVEYYLEDRSEENLEGIDSWLDTLGIDGTDPEKLADSYEGDNSYWNETVSKFNSNMRIQFDGDYFGEFGKKAWNFLVLSPESLDPELYGQDAIHNTSPCFDDFFDECPFNLCYNNDSDILYTWSDAGNHKYEFLETGLMKQDLQLPIIDVLLKILNSDRTEIITQLIKNFLSKQTASQLYKEIIQRLQEEGNSKIISTIKGARMLGRFGVI
jgi:hypothetical protein